MRKIEFVEIIANKTKTNKNIVEKILFSSKELLIEILNKNGNISLSSFGKFVVCVKPEKLIKNPITKRFYYSESKKYVKFKPFKGIKYCIK